MEQPKDRMTFKRPRMKVAGFVLGSAAFVALGLFIASAGDSWMDRAMGWMAVVFFGAVFLSAGASLFRGTLMFILDRNAITDTRRGIVIPWSEVREAREVTVRGQRFLALSFKDREMTLARASALTRMLTDLNERMGWGGWTFTFAAVSPGIDEALDFIRQNVPDVPVRGIRKR